MPRKKNAGATRLPEYTKARQLPKHAWPALRRALREGRRMHLDRDSWFVDAKTGEPIAPHPDIERELPSDFFERAELRIGHKVIRRGRPPGPGGPKRSVTIRLDPDVIAHFQKAGAGWQSRINAALRRAAGLSSGKDAAAS